MAATLPDLTAALEAPEVVARARTAVRRRRGVVPNNLRARIDSATSDFQVRLTARFIAASLEGLHPSMLTPDELADLREVWGADVADTALAVLADPRVGYGLRPAARPRRQRAHGIRREQRLQGVLGKLPRSLALRLPTTADTHRSGRNDGVDRWGRVTCSQTLRAEHLGVLAAVGGLWHSRAGEGEGYVDTTAGELVHLVSAEQRVSGKSIVRIHARLAELEALELRAEVNDRPGKPGPERLTRLPSGDVDWRTGDPSGPSEAHRIPCTPIERVERRLGDRWVSAQEYAEASRLAGDEDLDELSAAERAACSGLPTIRIHLAQWFRAELGHPKRRPVFVQFDVWRHHRPSAQRLYAFVQALGRDDYDGRIYFYLAPPTRFTLGISTERLDRAASDVSHDLTALWHSDKRYRQGKGFRRHKHADTKWPAFACDAAHRPSAPTDRALSTKSPAKRPSGIRGAAARLRRHSILGARGVSVDQLDQAHVRRVGVEAARREAEQVREAIQRSMFGAATMAQEPGPFEPNRAAARARRQTGRQGDEDDGSASPASA